MRNPQILTTIIVPGAATPLASQAQMAGRSPGGFWDWNWGQALFSHLPMAVLWPAVFAVILLPTVRLATRKQQTALDKLRQRYVRGEIDNGKLEERRHLLSD